MGIGLALKVGAHLDKTVSCQLQLQQFFRFFVALSTKVPLVLFELPLMVTEPYSLLLKAERITATFFSLRIMQIFLPIQAKYKFATGAEIL